MGTFLIIVGGWIFTLCLHEFAHALVAYAGGDHTVKEKGYLSFNPLKYADPVMSVILPVIMVLIGGLALPGGAVYIEHWRLKSRWWDCAVSAAGPAANILCVAVIAIAMHFEPETGNTGFWDALAFLGELQIAAVLFNLMPIPPLDGFGMLAPLYTREEHIRTKAKGSYIIFIIYFAMMNVPNLNQTFWNIISGIGSFIGISPESGYYGYEALRRMRPW